MRLCLIFAISLGLLQAQDPLVQGLEAFRGGRNEDAVAAFQQAVDANPANKNARLYLAAALLNDRNSAGHQRAEDQLRSVLAIDGNNTMALGLLGRLYFLKAQFSESKKWYERLAQADPLSKDAFYSLGVIAWASPSSPAVIDEGIRNLEKAVEIDPNFSDAFAYLNLLCRLRADMTGEDRTKANGYREKSLATKSQSRQLPDLFSVRAAAPPDAPPPPKPQIRVGAEVQAAKLVNHVPPVYPPLARQARVQGTPKFTVIIDKEGRVASVQLISGHPLLVQAAMDAIKQWVYQPTLLNGAPVVVATVVEVSFTLSQ